MYLTGSEINEGPRAVREDFQLKEITEENIKLKKEIENLKNSKTINVGGEEMLRSIQGKKGKLLSGVELQQYLDAK